MRIKQALIIHDQPPAISPAYFRSLTLCNVKCFKDEARIDFEAKGRLARWTIILGENGVGKTTILQSLAGLCARPNTLKHGNVERPVISQAMSDASWFDWHEQSQRKTSAQEHSFKSEIMVGSTLERRDPRNTKVLPWNFKFQLEQREQVNIVITGPAAESKMLAGLQCYAYGAGRRMSSTSRSSQHSDARNSIFSLFSDDLPLPNAEEWLLELDHAAKTQHSLQTKSLNQFHEVKGLLLNVLPHIEDIRVQIHRRGAETNVRLEFKSPFGWVRASQLSFGYQTVVAWVVDLAKRLYLRYPHSANPIAQPAIVLIDELDLHLHPKWQRGIMEHLSATFRNTQFIVTAHSPLIVQAIPDSNIVLLQRDGDRVVINQSLDMVKNWRIDQILTSDLFGLETARPEGLVKIIDERAKLLAKPKLSKQDEDRLRELNKTIHLAPSLETDVGRKAEELIKRAAKLIKI